MRPWCILDSAALKELLTSDECTAKGTVCRYRAGMRSAKQWMNEAQGRVWAPLCGPQRIPAILNLCKRLVNPIELSGAGIDARLLSELWLHGMRENKVFSSPTPTYMGNVILHSSGSRDYLTAPFAQLKSAMASGRASCAEAFVRSLKANQTKQIRIAQHCPHSNHH